MVYEELRRIAHGRLRHERDQYTLQTTGLVNEVYSRLRDQRKSEMVELRFLGGLTIEETATTEKITCPRIRSDPVFRFDIDPFEDYI